MKVSAFEVPERVVIVTVTDDCGRDNVGTVT
jgi:hypothetical protein